jgi:ABC-2 type transport system ATP-binding protein
VHGKRYTQLRAPPRDAGSMLDARAVHGGHTAFNDLLALARSNGIPKRRVDEVFGLAGLSDVADRWTGGFSVGACASGLASARPSSATRRC